MSTGSEKAGNDFSNMSREEIEAELKAARERSVNVEAGSKTQTERTTETRIVKERGRVGSFFSNMGKTTVAVSGVVAGALLGVGGTVLYHKRTTRTAVGSTGGDEAHVSTDM